MKMTKHDWQLHEDFWKYMRRQNLSCFTSDNIRFCFGGKNVASDTTQLQTYFPNPSKDIGAWVAKCKLAGLFIGTEKTKASTIESNHGHKNPIYKMRGLTDTWTLAQQENR
jgi:hypothetical protein